MTASTSPNTPRERLETIKRRAEKIRAIGILYPAEAADLLALLCDVLLDSGLLDQANEGGGLEASEASTSLTSPADTRGGVRPIDPPTTVPQPPSPAPAFYLIELPHNCNHDDQPRWLRLGAWDDKAYDSWTDDVRHATPWRKREAANAYLKRGDLDSDLSRAIVTEHIWIAAPAPASVEGEVIGKMNDPWSIEIAVPFDCFKLGTRVRVTPLDPEGT